MPQIVKTRSDADFLGLVPHLLGFRPKNSVVLIGFHGKRTHGALRLDLPVAAIAFRKVATFALGTMSKVPGLDALAVVVFTDAPVVTASLAPHAEFVTILTGRIARAGLGLKGAWCLGGDGWVSYDDPLREVRSINEIELSDAALSQKESLAFASAKLPHATEGDQRRAAADLAHYRKLVARKEYDSDLAPLNDVALFVEQALEWNEHEALEFSALLLFLVQDPTCRDATMLQWASNLRRGESMWADESGSAEGADIMLGRGPRPKRERVESAIAVMARVASLAGPKQRAAPLCMLAWLHWAIGQGSIGGQYLEQALAADPDYGLANLLNSMFGNGYLPPWAFAADDEAHPAELAT